MKAFLPLALAVLTCCMLAGAAMASAPPNDDFSHAQPLTLPAGVVSGTTLGATLEKGDPATSYGVGGDVWYSFTAPANGDFALTAPAAFTGGGSVSMILYEGSSITHLKPIATDVEVSGTGYANQLSGQVLAGKKYYLNVGFFAGSAGGAFQINYAFETAGAFAFIDPPSNGFYQWTYLEGTNSTVNLTVGRYGSSTGTAAVSYNIQYDPRLSGGLSGTLTFAPGVTRQSFSLGLANDDTSGTAYLVAQLTQSSSDATILPEGSIFLRIEGDANTVPNDDFANAQALDVSGSSDVVVTGSVALPYGLATTEQGEIVEDSQSIWYSVTPPSDGLLTVSPGSQVFVTTGSGVASQLFVPEENNINGNTTAITPVTSGSTYYVVVDGIDDTTGYLDYTFDPAGSLMDFQYFSAYAFDAKSKPSTVSLTVIRSGATAATATVHYATNGSGDANAGAGDYSTALAAPGVDFTPVEGTLTFGPGVTSQSFEVAILRNPHDKTGQKHIDVVLDNPDGTELGAAVDAYINLNPANEAASEFQSYSAVLQSATGESVSGLVSLTYTKNYKLDAKVQTSGTTYTGQAASNDDLTQYTIPLADPHGSAPLTLNLQISGFDFEDIFSGTLLDSSTTLATFDIQSEASVSNLSNPGFEGSYTLSLTSGTAAPASVQAPGWALLNVLSSKKYVMTGELPDGTRFTAGGPAGGLGIDVPLLIPVAIPLDKGRGNLGGTIMVNPAGTITEPAPSGDGFGSLQWVKPSTGGTGGFTETLGATVSQYAPASLATILGDSSGRLIIGSGSPIIFTINSAGHAVFPGGTPGDPALSFTPATGLFSGAFTPTGGHRASFSGVILPDTAEGFGFMIIGGEAAQVTVTQDTL